MGLRSDTDLYAGILFSVIGTGFLVYSFKYDIGTVRNMGSAFFPTVLSLVMLALGLSLSIKSLRSPSADRVVEKFHFRPLLIVLSAVVLFGVLLIPFGFVISAIVLIVLSCLAYPNYPKKEIVALVLALLAAGYGIFIAGLGLPIPVWTGGY